MIRLACARRHADTHGQLLPAQVLELFLGRALRTQYDTFCNEPSPSCTCSAPIADFRPQPRTPLGFFLLPA